MSKCETCGRSGQRNPATKINPEDNTRDLITTRHAASILGYTMERVNSLIRKGKLPSYKLGDRGRIFLNRSDIISYAEMKKDIIIN